MLLPSGNVWNVFPVVKGPVPSILTAAILIVYSLYSSNPVISKDFEATSGELPSVVKFSGGSVYGKGFPVILKA